MARLFCFPSYPKPDPPFKYPLPIPPHTLRRYRAHSFFQFQDVPLPMLPSLPICFFFLLFQLTSTPFVFPIKGSGYAQSSLSAVVLDFMLCSMGWTLSFFISTFRFSVILPLPSLGLFPFLVVQRGRVGFPPFFNEFRFGEKQKPVFPVSLLDLCFPLVIRSLFRFFLFIFFPCATFLSA